MPDARRNYSCLAPFMWREKDDAAKEVVDERPNVEILQVHEQSVSQLVSYTATVEAYKTNNITTSTPNRIKSILVDVGSKVARGSVSWCLTM